MKIVSMPRVSVFCYGLWLVAGIAGGCATDGAGDEPEAAASSAITFTAGASYTLVGVQSGKCVGAANTASTTQLTIQTCTGTANQRFRPVSVGGGFFQLRNELSGLCTDVSGAQTTDGAAVIQFACSTATNQQFSFTDIAGGSELVTARHSGKVLDVTAQGTADGTLVEQFTSNNGGNQHFVMTQQLPAIIVVH